LFSVSLNVDGANDGISDEEEEEDMMADYEDESSEER
jgi:hypothetical protein